MKVNGKVAVVTGGASGIGLALCTRFAKEGAQVVLSDLDQEAGNRHAEPIGALPVAADVGREEDIKNLVAATMEHFGRLDLFVSNAGAKGDALAFNQWRVTSEHRPLGEIMDVRRVYTASAKIRRELNHQPQREPTSADEVLMLPKVKG
jgi:NAD(P)-dependent dehydrogenase (short-subunit alcohol dehydrogenase family)